MATDNIVPRADGEGSIGTSSKAWNNGYFKNLNINGGGVAPLDSPAFTGTPTAPTPANNDNSNKLATTKFVKTEAGNYLPLSGGTLTGNLGIKKDSPQMNFTANNIERSVAPSANYSLVEIQGLDKSNYRTWGILHNYNTEKSNYVQLIAYNGLTTDYTFTGLGVGFDKNGYPYTFAPTPTKASNDTNIATTAFVKTNLADYLPLSGGTMTGAILGSGGTLIAVNKATSYLQINGGVFADDGAKIILFGKDEATRSGRFYIDANDGTNLKRLTGLPDGTLTWDNKQIERVNASGTNYIRYENGLQICFGRVTGEANTTSTAITFPQAFKGNDSYYGHGNIVTSSITANSNTGNYSTTGMTVYHTSVNATVSIEYIAVGFWK